MSDEAAASAHGSDARGGFRFIVDWPAINQANAAAIAQFWQREGAIVDDASIAERLPQVVMHAQNANDEIAAVCTAVAVTPPALGQPMYYWRTFVGQRWRTTGLVMSLLKRSCTLLETHARENDFPCIGVLLELENDRFRERGRAAVWWNPSFTYIGRSDSGLDVRVLYFRGAKLKQSAQI